MSYKHDVFISYRRNPETLAWINDHFVPLLSLRLEFEIQRPPAIFVDEQIESGTAIPPTLGAALGASRILIALWTGNYFSSVWCTEEFAQMLDREQAAKLRTTARPYGLIFPTFIHDGNSFPADLQHIKPVEIQSCFNPRMAKTGLRAEELDTRIAALAPALATSIENAPAWRKQWPLKATKAFYKRFHRYAQATQTSVPRFTQP
jgi:hypothetical protein